MSGIADDFKIASRIFGALGSPVRLKILTMLMESKKPLHITAVATNLKMDYGGVYRHVEVLKTAGLIQVYEVGRSRVLAPQDSEVIKDLIARTKNFVRRH